MMIYCIEFLSEFWTLLYFLKSSSSFSRLLQLDEHYMEAQNSSFNFTSDLHFKFLQMEF